MCSKETKDTITIGELVSTMYYLKNKVDELELNNNVLGNKINKLETENNLLKKQLKEKDELLIKLLSKGDRR